ncbi:hypothetical protein [Shewanella litorisediminis]|uniref:DUF4405 domain-containing protein n=1 Tax=Shewanella litorisediminis TaxID=1173586 RepID=A0ABX7G101_9GAMM|nr:hypothetical protein [Shewanella litorisediminis]MCL2918869.1 hypothetical protein [Shewanella litorisediminis]QRH00942.1 hypothetical protein JQC75_13870 [Shewanella litorisediminis]
MKRLNGYPDCFFYLLIVSMTLCAATGFAMYPWVLEFKLEWELPMMLNGRWRLPLVSTHALSAAVLLILLGALWQVHIRAGWRKKKNHVSGLLMSLSMMLLMLTGVGLYYLSAESAQFAASLAHSGMGLSLVCVFTWHWVKGRRVRRQKIQQAASKHTSSRQALKQHSLTE